MRSKYRIILLSLFSFLIFYCANIPSSEAASGPYDVPSDVRNNWDNIRGGKQFTNYTGKRLLYDVYSYKGISKGYRIVNKNFGKGTQPYINFEGWSVIHGHAKHTYANNETYIVARKIGGSETKIYSTQKQKSLSATQDLAYNSTSSGLYNECPDSARNKRADDCNMRYNNVDFQAFIPIEELFPDPASPGKWRLFIVKKVNNHMVFDEIRLPFSFDNLSYEGGDISLSSGVNANKLIMNNAGVLRRRFITQTAASVYSDLGDNRHFTQGRTYTMVKPNETGTTVFYGVKSTHSNDKGKTKYASSAYWMLTGDQAVLEFIPDDNPPIHISDKITDHRYRNGNDYWVQPNDDPVITLRQRDTDSGNRTQYMRLMEDDEIITRNRHDFYDDASTNRRQITNSQVAVDKARRTENTSYGTVEWTATPKVHGKTYNIEYYYRDMAFNYLGYNRISKRLRVDGIAPNHERHSLTGAKYVDGSNYWVNSNDTVKVTLRQRDRDSGNKYQYIRLYGSDTDVRKRHNYSGSKDYIGKVNGDHFIGNNLSINTANRTEASSYGTVEWTVTPKQHGDSFNIMYYYQDNVDNHTSTNLHSGYGTTGMYLKVDDIAPQISYRDKEDKRDLTEREWHDSKVNVRLKFHDEDSGYKESRFTWSKSPTTPKENEWSDWSSSSDYTVTKSKTDYGEWYLHVQAKDNVGNINTEVKGLYKVNTPPVADFTFTVPHYEGNPYPLKNTSTDAEDHDMTAIWTVELPDGETETYTDWNLTLPRPIPGYYTVTLEVTDEYGAKDEQKRSFVVIPLVIQGQVDHTDRWKELHEKLGNTSEVFFSGERFLLTSSVTNQPISEVSVTFKGIDINDEPVEVTEILLEDSQNRDSIIHKGEIYEEFMANPETKLKTNTNGHFIFKATWENGIVKEDVVTVRITGDVYDFYKLHKTN